MLTKPCDSCGAWKQLTHHVTSDILNIDVRYECGLRAELIQSSKQGGVGNMTVEMIQRPTVIPMFFECSICHASLTGEQQYLAHHWENHS